MSKVCGVGINDYKGRVKINNKHIKSYTVWRSMLERCYDERRIRKQPTYSNCFVCEEWLYFSNFKSWFDENYIEGYELDKDFKQKKVKIKIYGPDTCIFVSKKDNTAEAMSRRNNDYLKGENNPFYGKKHTKETIERIKKGAIKRTGSNNKMFGLKGEKCPFSKGKDFYKENPRTRSKFKYACKRQGWVFDNFEEVFSGEFFYRTDGYREKLFYYIEAKNV